MIKLSLEVQILRKPTFILLIVAVVMSLSFLLFAIFFSQRILTDLFFKKIEVNPYCLLVVGTDAVIERTVRTDVIMVVIIDHEKGNVLLTNIPRDLLIGDGKINAKYEKTGISGLKDTVSDLLNLEIHGYAVIDYDVFKFLGDSLGPIEIQIQEPMKYVDSVQNLNIDFQPGTYLMNGEQLLAYIRYRRGSMGDISRIERQKEVLLKLIDRARTLDLAKMVSIFSHVYRNVTTDVGMGEMAYLFSRLKKKMNMSFLSFPYKLDSDGNVIIDSQKLESYRNSIITQNLSEDVKIPKILIINCSTNKTRGFLVRLEELWNSKVGFLPHQIVWEDIGVNYSKNTVFVLNKAMKTEIAKVVEAVYPEITFDVKIISLTSGMDEYLGIIKKMSDSRIYPSFPFDALVVVVR